VEALLRAFYDAALDDGLLAPVFRAAGMRLETHLPRIAAFWEVTLLGTGLYTGSPLALHRRAAAASGLGGPHFARWLLLWERTVRSMFAGPTATCAITEARRMAVGMLRDLKRHPVGHEGILVVPRALITHTRTVSS
jgi:hemoglobin